MGCQPSSHGRSKCANQSYFVDWDGLFLTHGVYSRPLCCAFVLKMCADSRSFVGLSESVQNTAIRAYIGLIMMFCCTVAENVESLEQSVLDEFRHSPPEQFKDDHQGQGRGHYSNCYQLSPSHLHCMTL